MNCSRFEELFIKESPKELLEHILQCQECKYEYEKMKKTEMVLKEAKPYFSGQKKKIIILKSAACFVLTLILSLTLLQNNFLNKYITNSVINDSLISDTNIPVDEYGLLDIE